MPAPICCGRDARLTDGTEIYPHRAEPAIADKPMWVCDDCGAYVGCHPTTTVALGTLAGPELRRLRRRVHLVIDPIWRAAHRIAPYANAPRKAREGIQRRARQRVYEFLADRLGIPCAECHVAMFDAARCGAAVKAMQHVDYYRVRAWARDREAAARAAAERNATPALSTRTAEEVAPC
ncbi:zinc-finger-containing protein [Methylobacterium aquaticum]|uniref:Uncharacterized protein n=1 Tax=Methylobacterium aquaticum TaxID=270351 RepID=A0A0C6FH11_9HYPH|nr:zinc-finger-containing protein [Methylobacterium aquaticum]BAQ44359.1 hypothetical protein Maq22A_c04755 [Methylobacterium aquaticum]